HGGKRRSAACCAPTGVLRPGAHGGAYPGPGRRGGAGRAGDRHRGCGGGAATRAESALEARDGPGGLPGRVEADAGDGAAQAGAGPPARRECQGAGGGTGRRQAPEARGGDRAVDDAGGAGRSVDPHRLAPVADRQGGGTPRAGREPAAGAVPADAEALEKDLRTLCQLAFGYGVRGARGRATAGSWWRTHARRATGGSSRCSATTIHAPTRPTSKWT